MRLRPVAGEDEVHLVEPGETLHDIAYVHRLGFAALRRLNPELDPWIPVPGTVVRLPMRFVLPANEPEGLVVNIPEMRLYDFTPGAPVRVLAVAVGDIDDPTPTGTFRVGTKLVEPVWHVPTSLRTADPRRPETVEPGEHNPLGSRWMTLGKTSYGIHGTNVRWSIGRDATHGCVRLYEDVMQALFDRVPGGTPVAILYEPYKWGTNGKDLFLEVHPDLYGRIEDKLTAALALPRELGLLERVDLDRVQLALQQRQGIPIRVGSLP